MDKIAKKSFRTAYLLMIMICFIALPAFATETEEIEKPPVLTVTVPRTLAIGSDLEAAVENKEPDTYLHVWLEKEKEAGTYVSDNGFSSRVWAWDEASGTVCIQEKAFETPGNYRINMTQTRYGAGGYASSDTCTAEFAVTGNRPAAPTVVRPEGTIYYGDTVWFWVSAEGADAVSYKDDYDEGEYIVQNGTGLIPICANSSTEVSFRARINGIWSVSSEKYPINPEYRGYPEEISLTIPSKIKKGQDLTITNIALIDNADLYTFSVGFYDEAASTEFEIFAIDQIVYDQPFDFSDGKLTIPGYHFVEEGKYGVTVTAYRNSTMECLGEKDSIITVTKNQNLPAAPTVTLLTTGTNMVYGRTQFEVRTTNGADCIYTFISRKNDDGLEENPILTQTDPSKKKYTIEYTNTNSGNMIAYFAVRKDGVWSAASTPLEYTVEWDIEMQDLGEPVVTCPDETVIGNPFTVRWSPVEHAEWYEVTIYSLSHSPAWSSTVPAGEGTSETIDTSGFLGSGEYYVKVKAYASGYYPGEPDERSTIKVLDPALRINAKLDSITDGIAKIRLEGVCSDVLRIRINGDNTGVIPIGPEASCTTISIPVSNGTTEFQVANYGTSSLKWGAWSKPVVFRNGALKTLSLPGDLVRIETGAFEATGCEAVIIPDGCESIAAGAFKSCENLEYVSCPEATVIADNAFEGCSKNPEIHRR